MEYEIVIGLEVHAELKTRSKIYCACKNEFGGPPNSKCCPICTGMPGVLPVLNRQVVEYAVAAGLATNCEINRQCRQDRKNYFYPDLPKAYQTSQYDLPICRNGFVEIDTPGGSKKIRLNRIHIEEDAGKLIHEASGTLIDYNRCGVPLIEIVTEPDLRSAEEAKTFLEQLKAILEYTGISDCKMQEGSLRCDVNVSVRPKGQEAFGTRAEMKNLNSFRAAYRAIEFEANRQMEELSAGREIVQETRGWDDAGGFSYSMRSKEEAHDYRYFPEPDLVSIHVDEDWIERIRAGLPELPAARQARYIKDYGLSETEARQLTSQKSVSDFFESVLRAGAPPKSASNWILGDVAKLLNADDSAEDEKQIPFTGEQLAKLIAMVEGGTINGTAAKKVLSELFERPRDPEEIVKEKGLTQISDESALLGTVQEVLRLNPESVRDYKAGKEKAMGYLIGQAMRATGGKANPQLLNRLIREELEKL